MHNTLQNPSEERISYGEVSDAIRLKLACGVATQSDIDAALEEWERLGAHDLCMKHQFLGIPWPLYDAYLVSPSVLVDA